MHFRSLLMSTWLMLSAVGCSNKISGSLEASTKEHGTFSIKPDACRSGERNGFFGVDLREGKSDDILRMINDPKNGYFLKMNVPGTDGALTVAAKVCPTFDVVVKKQNSTINGIKNVKGHLKVDCKVGTSTMKANIKFKNCH